MNIRVLVVEDEALLAIDIAGHLTDAGFSVIGPAASVTKALALIKEGGCDIAVLDVNLRDETSEPIARELRTNGTPFIFVSGISREQPPDWFEGVLLLPKPVRPAVLVAALRPLVPAAANRSVPR
jgi:DNA-binding response OmpR family regulator